MNNIEIGEGDKLHTIYIPSEKAKKNNIYLSHGFGGTSLMYFPVIPLLLEYGNVILWEIRGMGVSNKPPSYNLNF